MPSNDKQLAAQFFEEFVSALEPLLPKGYGYTLMLHKLDTAMTYTLTTLSEQ